LGHDAPALIDLGSKVGSSGRIVAPWLSRVGGKVLLTYAGNIFWVGNEPPINDYFLFEPGSGPDYLTARLLLSFIRCYFADFLIGNEQPIN
jgi:hypothetical protein